MTFRHTIAHAVTRHRHRPACRGRGDTCDCCRRKRARASCFAAPIWGCEIPARYDLVGETRLGTVLEKDGASVGVVEHLMAACAGAEIDDLTGRAGRA